MTAKETTKSELSELSSAFEKTVETLNEASRVYNNAYHDLMETQNKLDAAKSKLDSATDAVRIANTNVQNYLNTQVAALPAGTPTNTTVGPK